MSHPCMFIRLAAAYFAASVIGFGCRSIIAAMTIDEFLVNVIAALPFRTGARFTTFSSYGHAVGADSLWSFAVMSLISAGILFMVHASTFVVAEKVVGIFAHPRLPDIRLLTGDPLPDLRFRAMTRSAWFGVYALPLALVLWSLWQEVSEASIRIRPGLLADYYITLCATFLIVPLVYLWHSIGSISALLSKILATGPPFCRACGHSLIGINPHRCPECGSQASNPRNKSFSLGGLERYIAPVFVLLIIALSLLPIWWPLVF